MEMQSAATPIESSRDNSSYMPQLDTLRALAALGVIVSHWFQQSHAIFPFGGTSVTLFFVLSGFLISRGLLTVRFSGEAGVGSPLLGRFFLKRIARIFPAYLLLLALLLATPGINFKGEFGWYALFGANFLFFFSQSWNWPAIHLWTLGVEEQFYLLWPLVLLYVPRRYLLKVILIAIACGPLARFVIFLSGDGSEAAGDMAHALMPSCMDSFGMGALLAYQRVFGHPWKFRGWPLWLFLSLNAAAAWWFRDFWEGNGIILFWLSVSILSTALIAKASIGFGGPLRWVMENPVLMYLGRISYGIYLYHLYLPELYVWLGLRAVVPHALETLVQLALLAGIASLSWHFFERPVHAALLRRLPKRRGVPQGQTAIGA